jgi:hypothetical protein
MAKFKTLTINTDAGFLPIDKVGAWAFWAVTDGMVLKGSGVFKEHCKNPTDAEIKAMCNAVFCVLSQSFDFSKIQLIVFNRDNINATSGANGSPSQRKLTALIKKLKQKCNDKIYPKVHFRHVKAHLHTDTPRHYVNDWCDKECKARLREWVKQNKQIKNQNK